MAIKQLENTSNAEGSSLDNHSYMTHTVTFDSEMPPSASASASASTSHHNFTISSSRISYEASLYEKDTSIFNDNLTTSSVLTYTINTNEEDTITHCLVRVPELNSPFSSVYNLKEENIHLLYIDEDVQYEKKECITSASTTASPVLYHDKDNTTTTRSTILTLSLQTTHI